MRWISNYDGSRIVNTNTGKEYPLHSGTDELWCKILNIIGERPSKYDYTIDKTDEGILIKVWYEKPIKIGYQVEFSNDTDIEDIIRTLLNVPFAFNNAYFKYSEEKLDEIKLKNGYIEKKTIKKALEKIYKDNSCGLCDDMDIDENVDVIYDELKKEGLIK